VLLRIYVLYVFLLSLILPDMPIEVIRDERLPKTKLPFSSAIKAGGFVFVSGQASVDDDGTVHPDTFENEFRRTMSCLERILTASGASLKQVVQVKAYLRDQDKWAEYNDLYRQYFKEPYPARTTITKCLGAVQVEIDVIAYVGA
jgi:2-iminobutanoate/2-iminopropanoate deaminase